MDHSIYYMIRQDTNAKYTVTKWDGGSLPVQVYLVQRDKGDRFTCTCPSGYHRRYCKHMDMVRKWLRSGAPEGATIRGNE